jgi:hypothetical protein
MKNRISAVLLAVYLIVGCSSGGGTSGAGGGSSVVIAGEFILLGTLVVNTLEVDTISTTCESSEEVLTTANGIFTITITNLGQLPSDLFPSGLILESYSVTYTPNSTGAPGISKRSYPTSSAGINGSALATRVIIADLSSVIPEFQRKNPSGTIHSYTVTVTVKGRTLAGESFAVPAVQVMEFGDFGACEEPEP